MGCLQSKNANSSKTNTSTEKGTTPDFTAHKNSSSAPLQYVWSHEAQKDKTPKEIDFSKLKAEDFLLSSFQDRVILRTSGQILGQAMNIDKCKNCDFYLLDNSSQIFIDSCEDCRFFIGPCSGSIFIRTSKNVKMIVACQQFRTRDCHHLDVSIFSGTRPVIESSSNISFSCFASNYIGLVKQFHESGLSVYNNHWNVVHDFTPQGGDNYRFTNSKFKITDWMKPLNSMSETGISKEEESENEKSCPIPPTTLKESASSNVIIFLPGRYNDAEQFLPKIVSDIIHTKEHKFSKPEIDLIFDKSENCSSTKQEIAKGPIIAIGTNLSSSELRNRASQIVSPESFYIPENEIEAKYMANYFFNVHRIEV